jgi:hypothetical protein
LFFAFGVHCDRIVSDFLASAESAGVLSVLVLVADAATE